MKKSEFRQLIREEINQVIKTESLQLVNEVYDLEQVKYSPVVRNPLNMLVDTIKKTSNLRKVQVASILNDIILALDLNKTEMTMYMNMIRRYRDKYDF
jgi:hypothetical protein